jgi:hypothetical protein
MIQKEAIAVFNPQDPVEQAIQNAYHESSGQWMTMGAMNSFIRGMATYRGLSGRLSRSPQQTSSLLFAEKNQNQYWYYPCDIVELRVLLSDRQISWHSPIMLFGLRTAQKLMPEYPICLALDRSICKIGHSYGGVMVLESNRLHLADALQRVLLRPYLSSKHVKTINDILTDTYGFVPVHIMHDLPGYAYEKVAGRFTAEEKQAFASTSMNEGVEGLKIMANNWYEKAMESQGPRETYDKPFLIGKLPKEPFEEDDVLKSVYEKPQDMAKWRVNDRGVFRYTDLALNSNGGYGAKTKHVPITRSLIQNPIAFTVRRIDDNCITIKVDGGDKEQQIPLDQQHFLTKVE